MGSIAFLYESEIHGSYLRDMPLGGIATSVIMLAEAFARKNHEVTVYNTQNVSTVYEGVHYRPTPEAEKITADLVVVNNSANALWLSQARSGAVWQHNRTSFSRIWKHREVWALIFKRPHLVVLSNDAFRQTPKWLPYRKIHVIPHAIEPMFMRPGAAAERAPRAFFASRASRNLKWVIEAWKQYVHPVLPNAEFVVCTPPSSGFPFCRDDLERHGIFYKGSLPKQDLADLINTCRVLAYPGHINETGCQVALQAIGLGLPIVSCGHGSLKDLVKHGSTGFIETDMSRYAERLIQVLTDQALWLRLHEATLQHELRKAYDERALDWIKAFNL